MMKTDNRNANSKETSMIRRGGTLIEVEIAIFVVAVGLLGLLALFPLGAANIALAVKDDRSAHSVANAVAFAKLENPGAAVRTTAATPITINSTVSVTPASMTNIVGGQWLYIDSGANQEIVN